MARIKRFDLHPYRARVLEALGLVAQEVTSARYEGYSALKIIHGCGKIKDELPEFLDGMVKAACPGEKFELFDKQGQTVLALCPDLAKDPDYGRHNSGITVVVL
ncbi:putative Smr domain-containing protein [Candidatus Termititenax dinenymphae]|uniref:Smr domain-containing protein n=1 Tax=Candidatus Termititenax dinenymphae TaxID=2218523 RepID=A0A388TK88_9BACT|nr:putative Smr domain-containing protein [Candidatus Termititenax dinenymphae]